MIKKDFKKWHTNKTYVHNEKSRVFFQEREIWFCYLGENVGYEQDGRGDEFLRPIIVLKKFNKEILWAIPLTKKEKKDRPYYFVFPAKKGVKSTAILSQIRLIDAKRLKYKTGHLREDKFQQLKTKIKQLLA